MSKDFIVIKAILDLQRDQYQQDGSAEALLTLFNSEGKALEFLEKACFEEFIASGMEGR